MNTDNTEMKTGDTKGTILLVEDDAFLHDMVSKKLASYNFTVLSAKDTESARKLLEQNTVKLVLLDLVLPGMSGSTFLEELKSDGSPYQDIPVIILSNLFQEDEIAKAKELGAVDFMVKSNHSPSEIVDRVEQFMKDMVA